MKIIHNACALGYKIKLVKDNNIYSVVKSYPGLKDKVFMPTEKYSFANFVYINIIQSTVRPPGLVYKRLNPHV